MSPREAVKRYIRPAVRPVLRRIGYDVVQYPAANPEYLRGRFLATQEVDLVIDVGANTGQYGERLRDGGYQGRIVSLEPMGEEYAALAQGAATDARWDTIRSAAGAASGDLTIHVAGNSISSSFLPMLDSHATIAPGSTYGGDEVVPIDRLDALVGNEVAQASRPFLKIDTQGYEAAVLDGAEEVLDSVVGLEIEMSMVPLYGGQMLMLETLQRLDAAGFRLAGISPGLIDGAKGEALQADGLFLRKDQAR